MNNKNQISAEQAVGVFDSGIGGLTVLRELRHALPHENLLYLGDTARTPYGPKGKETIIRYSLECANFLTKCNVKILVVACNTASAQAWAQLTSQVQCPIVGTIESATKTAIRISRNNRIGVIGTEATIGSRVYEKRMLELEPSARVYSVACPLFVPLVENGMFSGDIVDKIIEMYLGPLHEAEIDTLVLGCTHYPLLSEAIAKFLGPNVLIVECSKAIAEEVKSIIDNSSINAKSAQGSTKYFVTDAVERFNKLASNFLGSKEEEVAATKVGLD